jgi:uncharacterized membrane protein HdeD (DUF308 family)
VLTETSSYGAADFFSRSWWVLLLRGFFAIVLGALVFTKPAWSLNVVMLAFAVYVLLEGATDLLTAIIGWRHRGDRWLLLLQALIAFGVGVVTLRTPRITAVAVILLMAFWAVGIGILKIVEGVRLRQDIRGEVWLVLGGVASVLFAMLVMSRPLVGAVAMVRMIGAYAVILGISEVMLAFRVFGARKVSRRVESGPSYRRVA